MSKKKSNNKNNYQFSNEVKQIKNEFKKLVDDMSDDDFLDMMSVLMFDYSDFEDECWTFDEEWEDEAIKFYNKEISNNSNFINDDSLPF